MFGQKDVRFCYKSLIITSATSDTSNDDDEEEYFDDNDTAFQQIANHFLNGPDIDEVLV